MNQRTKAVDTRVMSEILDTASGTNREEIAPCQIRPTIYIPSEARAQKHACKKVARNLRSTTWDLFTLPGTYVTKSPSSCTTTKCQAAAYACHPSNA